MYSAKKLFEKKGLEVIPYKVDYKTAGESAITVMCMLSKKVDDLVVEDFVV